MALTHLPLILLSIHIAHAAPALHNDDTQPESSVVRNWTLVCEDLCSLNLSGPGCGLDCHQVPVDGEQKHSSIHDDFEDLSSENRANLCAILCEFNLGGNRCNCKVPIEPAALTNIRQQPDKRKICNNFCRLYNVTLRGCTPCPHDPSDQSGPPLHRHQFMFVPMAPVSPPPVVTQSITVVVDPPPTLSVEPQSYDFQTNTEATTPDWSRLCSQLCRNGKGGILCNCDLTPW